MYQAQSKSLELVYIFDEFKLTADSIKQHSKLKFKGKIIETLEISLSTPIRNQRLIDILGDCITEPVRKYVANGCYDNAVDYIMGLLCSRELVIHNHSILVHIIDTTR